MPTQTFNINETDIWKRVDNIGRTKYINVVDGTERVVPWGSLDWLAIIWGNLFAIGISGAIIYIAAKLLLKF